MEKWFKAHNYQYVITGNHSYFWQTEIATGQLTPRGRIIWHNKEFYNQIKGRIKTV